jgi:hypothetical protein
MILPLGALFSDGVGNSLAGDVPGERSLVKIVVGVLAALVLEKARVAVTGRQGSDALTEDAVILDMIFADARAVGSFHVQRAAEVSH